jgi:uncharacterized protein GlcG (DUF336 family)
MQGSLDLPAFPDDFPNQSGLPVLVDGRTLGGIAASGARPGIDQVVARAGRDALFGNE